MTPLKIEHIEQRIRDHRPDPYPVGKQTRQAAVATILRPRGDHVEALFILRASQAGDPWSGHMAFPGGHRDPGDPSLRHTAERETLEEIGVDLSVHGRYVGPIDQVKANPRGSRLDMVVTPFVYVLESDPSIRLNHEVAEVLWGSLNHMHSGQSLTEQEFQVGGAQQMFRGYGVGGQLVWGLTYRMLDLFFELLDPGWERWD